MAIYRAYLLHTSLCGTPSKMSSIGSVSVLVQRRVSVEHMEAISVGRAGHTNAIIIMFGHCFCALLTML